MHKYLGILNNSSKKYISLQKPMFERISLEFFKLNSDSPLSVLNEKENAAVAASIWVFYKDFRLCKRI